MKFALATYEMEQGAYKGPPEGLLETVQDPDVPVAQEMNIHLCSMWSVGPTICQAALWFGGQQGTEEAEPLFWWGCDPARGARASWVTRHVAVWRCRCCREGSRAGASSTEVLMLSGLPCAP